MTMPRATSVLRALVVTSAVALVAACGQGAASPSASAAPSATAASPSASAASPSASAASPSASTAATNTLALTGKEYVFEGPSSVAAGITTITLQNAGHEEHQAQLAKLNDGKTFDDLVAALQAGPDAALGLVSLAGGPTAVVPGATGETTVDLKPGNYAFLCFFTAPDGLPHLAKGMIRPLEVTGTSAGGALPTGDAAVTAKDFTFQTAGPVAPGKHTFTFTNTGPQPHEAGLIKLAPGVTAEQVVAAINQPAPSGSASPSASASAPAGPPFQDAGGSGAIAPGSSATFTVTLEAGASYAFICFVPDPASGAPHAALGMVTAIPTS